MTERLEPKPFPCTNCGLCCNRKNYPVVGGSDQALQDAGFPYEFNPDTGWCEKYDLANKRCSVYADRPLLCRVLETKPPAYSVDKWYGINATSCNKMIRAAGLPDSFLVVEVLDK